MGTDHRPQYVFQGSQFRPRSSAPRPPMVFPPNFPVDIFITKELFKNGMKAIHTEMKKHENFQQNMYNKLHDDEPDEGHPPHDGEKRQRLYLASLGLLVIHPSLVVNIFRSINLIDLKNRGAEIDERVMLL